MPVNTLSPDVSDKHFQENADARQHYRHTETVSGTGDWLFLPAGLGDVFVSVVPASGTARVEYTQSPFSDLEGGSPVARPWDAGDVSAFKGVVMTAAVTAIRCVSSASADFVVTA